MRLRRLSTRARGFDARLAALTRYEAAQDARVQRTVRSIIAGVRARGDRALLAYARRLDGVKAKSVRELQLGAAAL
jgi:histidinol dehydrogenase